MATGTQRVMGLSPGAAQWALGASLFVNFLLLGLASGAVMKSIGAEDRPRGSGFHFSRQIVEAAGPDRREAVRRIVEGARGEEWKDASRRRWAETAERIAAQPFDGPALTEMLSAESARRAEQREARNAATVSALALLTDDERAALAASMQAHLEKEARRR